MLTAITPPPTLRRNLPATRGPDRSISRAVRQAATLRVRRTTAEAKSVHPLRATALEVLTPARHPPPAATTVAHRFPALRTRRPAGKRATRPQDPALVQAGSFLLERSF